MQVLSKLTKANKHINTITAVTTILALSLIHIYLRDYYPFYTSDCFMEVSEEVAEMFKEFDRKEGAEREHRLGKAEAVELLETTQPLQAGDIAVGHPLIKACNRHGYIQFLRQALP